MADLLAEKSFDLVLDDVQEQIGEQRFALWFANCKLVSLYRGVLTIGVPNVFFQDWIQSHYENNIRFAVERVLGISLKLEVVVDDELREGLEQRRELVVDTHGLELGRLDRVHEPRNQLTPRREADHL